MGVSVTAFTGADLDELGLGEPADLAAQTPNLNANIVFGNSIPNMSIRGVGLNDYAVNNNPAVGVYADEVYLVSPAMFSFQLFDLDRVEVLNGPQGTLYGRNTTAGAINFVSRRPDDEFEAYVDLGYGNLDRTEVGAALSGPPGEAVSARIAFRADRQGDGHQHNRATGRNVGEVDRLAWRGMIRFQPSDAVDILAEWHAGRDEADTLLLKVDNIFTPEDDAFFPGDPFSSPGRRDTIMDIESDGRVLTAHWSPSAGVTFTSITAMEEFSRRHCGGSRRHVAQPPRRRVQKRDRAVLAGSAADVGERRTRVHRGRDLRHRRGRHPGPLRDRGLLPGGHLPVPGRRQRVPPGDRREGRLRERGVAVEPRLAAHRRPALHRRGQGLLERLHVHLRGRAAGRRRLADRHLPGRRTELRGEHVSGRIGVDYTGWQNALVYLSLAKGFKSGNFQGQLTFNPTDLAPFDEEVVLSYEVGFKERLADKALFLTAAAFFYDYRDVQIYGSIYTEPIDPLFGIDNVGDAEVLGAELDLSWQLTGDLGVHLGVGLRDTEITKSVLSTVASGSWLPNAPETNFNVRIDCARSLANGMTFELLAHASYKDEVAYDIVRDFSVFWALAAGAG